MTQTAASSDFLAALGALGNDYTPPPAVPRVPGVRTPTASANPANLGPTLSAEQQRVIDTVAAGHNVIVDACIGSGKTTTIQRLCSLQPAQTEVLYLTYSRLLKQEAQDKVTGAKVQNYHGIVYPHLLKHKISCGLSESIRVFNEHFDKIAPGFPVYDLLVIDEYQDINEQYAQLIRNIVSRNPTMQIVMVGDPDQKVQSNTRLDAQKFAAEITASTGRQVHQLPFTQSFRMGADMGNLLSEAWTKTIAGMNSDQKVSVMTSNKVVSYLAQHDPGDILCLGKRRGLMSHTLNALEQRYPERFNKHTVYATVRDRGDQGSFDDDTAVFTTYDSSKGMERDVCVVFDYEQKYWELRGKYPDTDYEVLRNIFLVAASRGKAEIIFVESEDYPTIEELVAETTDKDGQPVVEEIPHIGGIKVGTFTDLPGATLPVYEKPIMVTECFNFKYAENVEACMNHIRRRQINDGTRDHTIEIERSDGLIDLSAPVGFYQEMAFFNDYDVTREMGNVLALLGWKSKDYQDRLDKGDPWYNARFLSYLETGQQRYLEQVTQTVDDQAHAQLMKRLRQQLRPDSPHQVSVGSELVVTGTHPATREKISTEITLIGEIDALADDDTVYELKFTSELSEPMFLQLASYLVLGGFRRGVLWNTRTNERWEVTVPNETAFLDAVITCMSKQAYTKVRHWKRT